MNGVREDIRFLSQRLKHFVYGVGSGTAEAELF